MENRLKTILIAVTGVFLGCVGLIILVYSFLRTPAGSRYILAQLQGILTRKANMRMEFKQGSVDPFSSIHFENLKLIQESGLERAEIQVKSVDIHYSFSLFSRTLSVDHVQIDHPSIVFHTSTEGAVLAAPLSTAQTQPHPPSFKEVAGNFLTPQIKIILKEFSLIGLNLELEQKTPNSNLKTELKNVNAHLGLRWIPNEFRFSGDFDLGDAGGVAYSSFGGHQKMELKAFPLASAKWGMSVRYQGGKWIYEVESSDWHFGVKNLSLTQEEKGVTSGLKLAQLGFESKAKLLAKTTEFLQVDKSSFETIEIKNLMTAGQLILEQTQEGKSERVQLDSQNASLNIDLASDIQVGLRCAFNRLISKSLTLKPANLEFHANTHLVKDLSSIHSEGESSLNGISLLHYDFQSQIANELKLQGKLGLIVNPALARVIQMPKGISQMGSLRADIGVQGQLKKLDLDSPMDGVIRADITQETKTGSTTFDPIHIQTQFVRAADLLKMNLDAQIPRLMADSLKKPWSIGLGAEAGWESKKDRLELKGLVKIQNENALRIQTHSSLNSDPIEMESILEVWIGNYLDGILTKKQLSEYGKWFAKTQLKVKLHKPKSSSADLLSEGVIQADGSTTIEQEASTGDAFVLIKDPIVVDHQMDLNHGKAQIDLSARIPSFEVPKVGKVLDTRFSTHVQTSDLISPKSFEFNLDLKQGAVTLTQPVGQIRPRDLPPLTGLSAKVRASLEGSNRFTMKEFRAEFNHSMMTLVAEATGDAQAKNFQTQGSMVVDLPGDFPPVASQSVHGRIEFPWTLAIYHGKKINFEGNLAILNLNWAKLSSFDSPSSMKVQGISGKVPVSEQLVWDGEHIKFANLISQNPFERVDFERVQPMIHESEQVDISEIDFEEKVYGPFQGYFSMRQNMIFAHKFDLKLGEGRTYGEMYFDTYPSNIQLGILARMTELNLSDLLPKKYLAKTPTGDQNLSGRSGLVVNLNSGTIDGRVDITQIGRTQLLTLLNVLDPKYEDEKMNLARNALVIAYPSFIQMSFQQGYMDMNVKLEGFPLPEIPLRGIPISPWVSSATAAVVKKTKEGPLK